MTLTLVSGGQTGVDRGAFETALRLGLDFGGWAPKGFRAEDGRIPEVYARRMRESADEGYALRTRLNVQDSDATLILSWSSSPEKAGGGTWFTEKTCRQQGKQCVHLRLPRAGEEHPPEVQDGVLKWLRLWKVGVLNVAGPRESKCPGIQAATIACLRWLLEPLAVQQVRQLTHELGLIEQAQSGVKVAPMAPASDSRYSRQHSDAEALEWQPPNVLDVIQQVAADLPNRPERPPMTTEDALRQVALTGSDDARPLALEELARRASPLGRYQRTAPLRHDPHPGPPEGLDALQRAQLDASIREAERDICGPEDLARARDREEGRDPVEERVRAYHDLVATAPGPIGVAEHDEDDHEPPAPGDPTA